MDASPRRRVLAALDPNAASPKPQLTYKTGNTPQVSSFQARLTQVPTLAPELKKRGAITDENMFGQPAKKARLGPAIQERDVMSRDATRSPSAGAESPSQPSPSASSVFDSSLLDTTQATNLTEPDMEPVRPTAASPGSSRRLAYVPAPTHPRLTREQARQKAEVLRLRLGLASYKLRTGQADIPLDRLQMRPLPGGKSLRDFGAGGRSRSETVIHAPHTSRRPLPTRRPSQEEAALARAVATAASQHEAQRRRQMRPESRQAAAEQSSFEEDDISPRRQASRGAMNSPQRSAQSNARLEAGTQTNARLTLTQS